MSFVISVTVKPQSRTQTIRWDGTRCTFICTLKSAPEKGKANGELIKFIAMSLSIPQSQCEIIGGHTERKKRLRIAGEWSHETLCRALGIESGTQQVLQLLP